jgi:hypothetical protein
MACRVLSTMHSMEKLHIEIDFRVGGDRRVVDDGSAVAVLETLKPARAKVFVVTVDMPISLDARDQLGQLPFELLDRGK